MSTILKALRRLEEDHDRERSAGSEEALPSGEPNAGRSEASPAGDRGGVEPRAAAGLRERILGEEAAAEAAGTRHPAQREGASGFIGLISRHVSSFAMVGILAIALGIYGFLIRDIPPPVPVTAEVAPPHLSLIHI